MHNFTKNVFKHLHNKPYLSFNLDHPIAFISSKYSNKSYFLASDTNHVQTGMSSQMYTCMLKVCLEMHTSMPV